MKSKKCRLLICIAIVIIVSLVIVKEEVKTDIDACRIQESIAQNIIRFHVRANSDSDSDQQLKLKVKNEVTALLQPMLSNSDSVEQSRNIIAQHMQDIKDTALDTIHNEGYSYDVDVYF